MSPISRRTFLRSVAALPIAARLDATTLLIPDAPRVAVIGAGAFGGWSALHLANSGASVTMLDAWGPGNARSSSGGDSRVIRAIYGPDRIYVDMVKRSYELWETLDASTDETLYTETGALWLHRGDDSYVRSALPILEELGFPVDQLTTAAAAKRYPQIDFTGTKSLWMERRAGVLSARRCCAVVRDQFVRNGGSYRTAHVKPGRVIGDRLTGVLLDDGSRFEADVYVFACGPWLGKLFPEILGDVIRPTRQEVYYFGTPAGSTRYQPGNLPVWIDFGERIFYGLPDTHERGFKIADDTRGEPIEPSSAERSPSAAGLTRARRLLTERFPGMANAPLIHAEVCQYENSPDGHLIIDQHPQAKNVWFVGGGSGHGFKLSPAVGEMIAKRILSGDEVPEMFRLERLRRMTKASTQFDTKKD